MLAISQVGIKRDWTSVDAQLGRQRTVERIALLGPRIIFELLEEFKRYHDLGADLDRRLVRYAEFDTRLLRALRGDEFAPTPLRVVRWS